MSSSKVSKDLDMKLTKIYKLINKQYKSITRDLVKEIVLKFDDFADVYISESHLTNKEKESLNNELLTKKILDNREYNEAASIATILNFILNMFIFMNIYESNEPERLFKGYTLSDWLITNIRKASLEDVKYNTNFNDKNIIDVYNRFMNINNDDILKLVKKAKIK